MLIQHFRLASETRVKLNDITAILLYEPVREKTNNLGFRPVLTQTGLYSHRSRLEASNFGFKKKRDCTIREAKTKALISFVITANRVLFFPCGGSLYLHFGILCILCNNFMTHAAENGCNFLMTKI